MKHKGRTARTRGPSQDHLVALQKEARPGRLRNHPGSSSAPTTNVTKPTEKKKSSDATLPVPVLFHNSQFHPILSHRCAHFTMPRGCGQGVPLGLLKLPSRIYFHSRP